MSGIALAFIGGSFAPNVPTVIGQAFGGGYYAGKIGVSGAATHYLIVGPIASAQSTLAYKNANTTVSGADSVIDGPQNTTDMVGSGDATVYPAAHFCNDLSTGGQTDWYRAAKNELEVCYYNLKPTTQNNNTSSGINANAVPARLSNYASDNPAQTSAAAFQTGNAEAFGAFFYWSSTENTAAYARGQAMYNGNQNYTFYKNSSFRVRAVRRVPV